MHLLRLSYLADQGLLIIQWPSAMHEAPIAELNGIMSQFQELNWPSELVRIYVSTNTDLESSSISAVPDLSLICTSVEGGAKKRRVPLIVECAFSQPNEKAFEKIKELIIARPEVLMAIVIIINENKYESPKEGSPAWERFQHDPAPLRLDEFTEIVTPIAEQKDVPEGFMNPVVAEEHTWCSIRNVEYHVWLKQEGEGEGDSDDKSVESSIINVDPTDLKQTDWQAHAVRATLLKSNF